MKDLTTPRTRKKRSAVYNPYARFYTKEDKEHFESLTSSDQKSIVDSENFVHDHNPLSIPIRFKILNSKHSVDIKNMAISKLNQLQTSNGDNLKSMQWITSLFEVPVGIYKQLDVSASSNPLQIKEFITNTSKNLDDKVFGHADAKQQIMRLLFQWISKPNSKGMTIGIQGPMGCGKTTLVKNGICSSISIPFSFIPLGGAFGSEFLDGHSFTYEGSTWGKVVQSLIDSKCMNPVIFFDELDKVSETPKGVEIINYLVHLTDSSQNDKVYDKYFAQVPLDLSKALIIFSYNNEESINPILRDRMFKIKTKGYTASEKIILFKDYLMPEILMDFAFKKNDIIFTDCIIKYLVDNLEKEQGVRNLKRALLEIIGQINLKNLMEEDFKLPHTVTQQDIKEYVKSNPKSENTSLSHMYI